MQRFHGAGLRGEAGGPVWGVCSADHSTERWKLQQELKKRGQALLISPAWNKHKMDQRRGCGTSQTKVHQALLTEFEKEMASFVNDECMVWV